MNAGRPSGERLLCALLLVNAFVGMMASAQTPREEARPPPRSFPFEEREERVRPSDPDSRPRRDFGDGRDGFTTSNSSLIRLEGGGVIDEDTVRSARETASHSTGTPEWKNPRGFEKDVFF